MTELADLRARLDGDALTRRLQELVATPSENPPGEEARVAALVATRCSEMGLDVDMEEGAAGRPSVLARWAGAAAPRLVYCTHTDVVPAGDPELWDHAPFDAAVVGGRLHGRGACDAKGCLAAAMEAVRLLKATGFEPAGTLHLMFVADEEAMGFKGAGHLAEAGLAAADHAIVGEPTSLRVVVAQRGASWIRLRTKGRAAHGSAPERGVNAIRHMAEIVLQLDRCLPDISHDVLGGPSINVGTIHGGEKVNVVPASCVIEIDRRSIPAETKESILASIAEAIDRAKRRFPEIDSEVEVAFAGAPFEVARDARVVREMASSVEEVQRRSPDMLGFRGTSDARFFAEAGAQTVLCGPGDIALAHTARESIDLHEVADAALAYALAFARLLSAEHPG